MLLENKDTICKFELRIINNNNKKRGEVEKWNLNYSIYLRTDKETEAVEKVIFHAHTKL